MCWMFQSSAEVDELNELSSSSSSSSSIGKNSDLWGNESSEKEDSEEDEVQSAYKTKSNNSTDALEAALPIRKGISQFYNGRLKSFLSLAEASTFPSIKEVAKPDDPYIRKRRNELAHHLWNKSRSFPHLSDGCGISKRPISLIRSPLATAAFVTLSRSESISSTNSDCSSNNYSKSPLHGVEPLHLGSRASHNNLLSLLSSPQRNVLRRRSFSLPDFRQCATAKTIKFSDKQ